MESVEVSARTVDEAIDIALQELGLKRSQVDIEVLTPGKPGIFGLGGEHARVRVTALEEGLGRPAEEEVEEVEEVEEEGEPEELLEGQVEIKSLESEEVEAAAGYLRELLDLMGIDATVSVREPETPVDGLGRATAVLDVGGEDLGLLIGRRGVTVAALQYLVNVMVTRRLGSRVLVTVDIEHYHRRREEALHLLARRISERVRQSRRPVSLDPMPPAERRIIHLALKNNPNVTTSSVGAGDQRKIVVRPRGEGRPPQRRPGGPGPGYPRRPMR